MRRREYRKKLGSSVVPQRDRETSPTLKTDEPKGKIEELRELIKREHERVVEAPVKPLIFRDDHGRVITERAWNNLQRLKEAARIGGYELDDYSQ